MSSPAADILRRLRACTRELDEAWRRPPPLILDWGEMSAALPDGGLPRGVVELCAPQALGATRVALAAVRAAQAQDANAWCAWIDPDATLYAPGVAAAGVDLDRLLVVRPPRADLGRVLLKVAQAQATSVIVADVDPVAGAPPAPPPRRFELVVRRLALLAEKAGASILLLSDRDRPRAAPWPVALRLELEARRSGELAVQVTKERRGRIGPPRLVQRP